MVLAVFADEGVEVVSEEVGAVHASVAVEHSEVGRLLPFAYMLRLAEVEDDGHSILIILSDGALVGRSRIGSNGAVSIFGVFGRLEV